MRDSTPILIGSGQTVDRDPPQPGRSLSPADMAAEAARRALEHTGCAAALREHVDVLAVARLFEHSVKDTVMWPNPFGCSNNMPWSVARRLELQPRRAIYAEVGGETPQRLVNQMAESIHAGETRVAVLTGAEVLATIRNAGRAGISFDWREEVEGEFEDLWPDDPMTTAYETRHGVTFPIQVYCLFEQVLRDELGLSQAAYRERLGRVFAPFSEVAAANPYAQFPTARSAEFLATPSAQNFQLCEPYNKWMVAQDAVNQGAAVVMTSVGLARELGVPENQWVFLRSYADVDDLPISMRPRLAASHAQGLALQRALDDSGLAIDDIALLDFYSCFPIAVEAYAEALGIDFQRELTLTGSMAFAGGPWNNYVYQATCRAAALLRAGGGCHALISSVSGMLTKQAFGLWSREPPRQPFRWLDETAAVSRAQQTVDVLPTYSGTATVAGYTVLYARDQAPYALAVVDTPDQRRALVTSRDPESLERLEAEEWVGREVLVDENVLSLRDRLAS
ncbi:MAG: acetyl-CoA acetyltransferase [Gammaproteobacteria bacterium]